MMLPMSIRCNTCGNYIYKGTKFNSRKEDVIGEVFFFLLIFCLSLFLLVVFWKDSFRSFFFLFFFADVFRNTNI